MPHDHGEHTAPDNDGSLAYRLEDYMTSGSFLMELGSFVAKHASMFEDVNTGEHPHQWFETYREYEAMLSKRVNAFLAAEGVTAEEAVADCRVAREAHQEQYIFFEYLAAAVDYQCFYRLMLEFKSHKRDISSWWRCLSDHCA
mmetsp:Transcript_39381/g.91308  ORF Transcript_39381/g.91308 Transcript_39381/m.91308 type:complete len:143 (-) Transcript_39381:73-501(-)